MIFVGIILFLERVDDLLFALKTVAVFLIVFLHLLKGGLKHVTIALEFHDTSLLIVGLLFEPVKVTEQVVHVTLGLLFFTDC